ncbi:MAG: UDP-N-acetylmuramate dehydrogenase [Burkholderiales bacterium]|nr:UDP-N-acetylmuramate dehydrogenase [Burkholderiales bacterium]
MFMAEIAHIDQSGLRGELRFNEPMRRHTSWHVGGPVDQCYKPADLADLANFLRQLPQSCPVVFVGLGSNLLVRDGGLRGAVVFTHAALGKLELGERDVEQEIYAEAGVASPKVARFAAMHGFEGGEFLAGIPGTIGGALAMNAGCYGTETWEVVTQVRTIDRTGRIRDRQPADFDIGYRSIIPRFDGEEFFAGGWFRFRAGNGEHSRQIIKTLLQRRINSQPLETPNAGSVFRNPPGDHAARLIESCGLKGTRRGGAIVSEKHANFIVNPGDASAADIEWLIGHVHETVKNKCGVDLVREVRVIGEVSV